MQNEQIDVRETSVLEVIVREATGVAIQAAMDEVWRAGGGRVVVPEGVYRTGSLRMRSRVELHLAKGAELLGGTKSEDYESFPDEVCAIHPENSSKVFLYAWDEEEIAITGEGVINGQGPEFFDREAPHPWGSYPKPPVERPRMVQFVRCKGVRLEGVTYLDSPCWTMLIRQCEDVVVEGIRIVGEPLMINNDGIDFDGCRHVRVRNSFFQTCDDCLILRAMRDPRRPEEHVVCEDIVVEHCHLDSRNQTIRLGCPSDDTIRNAVFRDIEAVGMNGIFADFPRRYLVGEDTGYMDIRDILVDGYRGSFTNSAIQIVSEPEVTIRAADGFVFRKIDVQSTRPLRFIGNPGHEIGSVRFEDARVRVMQEGIPVIVQGCTGLAFENVEINGRMVPDGIQEENQPKMP